jgi:hypothetical protein
LRISKLPRSQRGNIQIAIEIAAGQTNREKFQPELQRIASPNSGTVLTDTARVTAGLQKTPNEQSYRNPQPAQKQTLTTSASVVLRMHITRIVHALGF